MEAKDTFRTMEDAASPYAPPGGQIVVFLLGGQNYALPIGSVSEIIKNQPVTPIPGTPAKVLGLANFRGRTLPILSLRTCLSCPDVDGPPSPIQRIMVVENGNERVGLLVDAVVEVGTYGADCFEAPVEQIMQRFIAATVRTPKELMTLLDLRQVLAA